MPPISSEFGKSLDSLRGQIENAEAILALHPLAEDQSICVEETSEGDFNLAFVSYRHRGLMLCKVFVPRENFPNDDCEAQEPRPVKELSVSEKLRYAKLIPELIDFVVEEEKNLPSMVKTLVERIEEKLASLNKA